MPKKGYNKSQLGKPNSPAVQIQKRWSEVPHTAGFKQYSDHIARDIEYLHKVLLRWTIESQQFVGNLNEYTIMKQYLKNYHEYTQLDQFDSSFTKIPELSVNLGRIKDPELIYKSFNLFKRYKWPVRFDSKFISKFSEMNRNQMRFTLQHICMIADGHFRAGDKLCKPIATKSFPYNRFFIANIFRQKNILIHIGVEKIPIVSRNNVIKRYEFVNFVGFVDIVGDSIVANPKKLDERLKTYYDKIINDVAKKDHSQQLQIEQPKKTRNLQHFFYDSINPYTQLKQTFETTFQHQNTVYYPLTFKVYYVSSQQTSTLTFDKNLKRWISQDFLDRQQRKKLNQYQRKINEEMVRRFVDFESAKSLVELLTKIPNFRVKLTEQEKNVIGENGNVMVIGRSGTGKTTCAVLRLFSIQMLFKIRLSLYKKKYISEIQNTRCSSNDIDQTMGLHCIFLTASPVLTNEIQRYYKKLTDNIKEELQRKKKRVQQEQKKKRLLQQQQAIKEQQEHSQIVEEVKQCSKIQSEQPQQMKQKQEQFQKIEQSEEPQVPDSLLKTKSKQVIEEQTQMNDQLQGIRLKEDLENEEFNEDQQDFDRVKDQFEEKVKKYQSLQDLEEKDYPGFFTVKSYIMMIDGTLQKPFFIRSKKSNQVLEQESTKAAWHNQRKGVMMIQNYYRNEENGQQVNQNIIQEIQEEINYSDEQELEHQYMRQIQLRANKQKQQLTKKLAKSKNNRMSFEVDFDYFRTHFWPNVNRRFYSSRNITPQLVWTEIYSTIKGSSNSHLFSGQYMPQKVYITASSNSFLTKEEKLDIYEVFCQYERWKIKLGAYDIMDAVNYDLNYIRFRGYTGPEIHYLMIDEVQDLPHAIIYLLSKTAGYGVFYSGDTAQTIAKGVGFRFCDLKSLFDPRVMDNSLLLKRPVVKHLTVNFRSHNNILQLANSVVSSLEILFPKTIDKLAKERSDLDGPKPMILAQNDEEMLFYVLCGEDKSKQVQNGDGMKKPSLQFGCDQVIIVRDQQSKQRIPNMLQHALCLTIYEAKGLQFNDVILFNFFTECKNPQKWSLLKYLQVVDYQISKQEYDRNLTKHKQEEQKPRQPQKQGEIKQPEEIDSQCVVEQKDEMIKIKKIIGKVKDIIKDINDYAELCSDLKLLYTAITRPRKTLIIYDENPSCRKLIEKMWQNLGIIQVVTKNLIQSQSTNENSNTNIFNKVIQATDKNEWKKQGLKMYSRGYFQQAMKCFEKSGNDDLMKKAQANLLADKATKSLIQVQSERNSIKQGYHAYRQMKAAELSKLKKKLRQNELRSYNQFIQAAKIFEDLRMYKQAGQCYFSGKSYLHAYETFMKVGMSKQAAQSLQMQQNYLDAAKLYDRDEDYLKMIECLDMVNEWEEILKVIKKYEAKMSEVEKSSLLKKYAALALEALVYEVEFENEDQSDNKEKKPENRIEVIQEKESDEQSDEEDQMEEQEENEEQKEMKESDPQKEAEQEYKKRQKPLINLEEGQTKQDPMLQTMVLEQKSSNPMLQTVYQKVDIPEESIEQDSFAQLNEEEEKAELKKQLIVEPQNAKDQQINEKMLQTVVDNSFAQLNISQDQSVKEQAFVDKSIKPQSISQAQQLQLKQSQSSFNDLNQSSDFSDLNAKYEKQLDPDIESIRSLADPEDPWLRNSISQINPHSQYSIIDQTQNYNMNVKIIKTKGNIFIQDSIMQKIIRIVSIITQSSTTFLQQFKGYQSLISLNKDSSKEEGLIQDKEIADFEDIDTETINLILDTLESFKLYKLCLFVCNRYHLPEKAGRYLVSIMMKYATNCQADTSIASGLLAPSTQRKAELQKGILGSIAVHSILQNVNSEFLKIKISSQQKGTLGSYFVQGLILQGFYKKTIFMANPEESLKVLENFSDYDTFKDVCRNKFLKHLPQKEVFLTQTPLGQIQRNFTLVNMSDVVRKYQVAHRLDMISYRYYKEFGMYDKINFIKDVAIPEYLPYLKNITQLDQKLPQFLDSQMPLTYTTLHSSDEVKVWDAVFGILSILHNEELQHILFHKCSLKTFLEYYRCLKFIKSNLWKVDLSNSLNIMKPLLQFYQCRLVQECKAMAFFGGYFVLVHRTSNMAGDILEQLRNNPQTFAFFVQQDFNSVLVKFSMILKIIIKKFTFKLERFLKNRTQLHRFGKTMLPDDYLVHNQQLVVIQAMKQALKILSSGQSGKKPKGTSKSKKTPSQSKPKFDYKTNGKIQHSYIVREQQLSSDSQQQQKVVYTRDRFVLPDFTKEMSYLHEQLLNIFNKERQGVKQVIAGKILYCANLNQYYREYVDKMGGYNLYDAIEFKRFKRVQLYADNILSVIDTLPLVDKHVYTAQILTLLLVQYKRLTQSGDQFMVQLPDCYLKFLENIVPVGVHSKDNSEFEPINSNDLHEAISIDKVRVRFAYNNEYTSDMTAKELIELICDYLEVLLGEESSQFVNFEGLCKIYLINVKPTKHNSTLYQKLRKTINTLGDSWRDPFYTSLSRCKNLQSFIQAHTILMKSPEPMNQIEVKCTGDIDKSIKQSQCDYEIQSRIIAGRKKALSKIISWWRKNKLSHMVNRQNFAHNYFDSVIRHQQSGNVTCTDTYKRLNDFRIMEKITDCNLKLNVPLLLKIQKVREDLLKFYLKHIINSSLDFHYILITLNKIQAFRKSYVDLCRELQSGIVERDILTEVSKLSEEIDDLEMNISVWKNDQKWLREKNLALKRKKVFEVKWMTKSLNQMKLIKKRAGLKKQEKLQLKKKILKG